MKIYVCEEYAKVVYRLWIIRFATKSLERAMEWVREDDENRTFTEVKLED